METCSEVQAPAAIDGARSSRSSASVHTAVPCLSRASVSTVLLALPGASCIMKLLPSIETVVAFAGNSWLAAFGVRELISAGSAGPSTKRSTPGLAMAVALDASAALAYSREPRQSCGARSP